MNKLLLLIVLALVALGVSAQDVIVLNDGTEVKCVVESVSPTSLTYKNGRLNEQSTNQYAADKLRSELETN